MLLLTFDDTTFYLIVGTHVFTESPSRKSVKLFFQLALNLSGDSDGQPSAWKTGRPAGRTFQAGSDIGADPNLGQSQELASVLVSCQMLIKWHDQ